MSYMQRTHTIPFTMWANYSLTSRPCLSSVLHTVHRSSGLAYIHVYQSCGLAGTDLFERLCLSNRDSPVAALSEWRWSIWVPNKAIHACMSTCMWADITDIVQKTKFLRKLYRKMWNNKMRNVLKIHTERIPLKKFYKVHTERDASA